MILTERHIIKRSNKYYKEMDELCFKSKNLYNSALYFVRQFFFEHKKYASWFVVNNKFVEIKQNDYYQLPAKVSQQTLKILDQNMKSFFQLLKNKNKKCSLPKYLHKTNGRLLVTYTNQALSKKDLRHGYIKPSKCNFRIKSKVKNPQQVRIVPHNGFIVVEVLYKKEVVKQNNKKRSYCGVDLGLNNLMACGFTDKTLKPILFNGRPLKSINHYYNKHKAKTIGKRKTERLGLKRNNKINDYLHKTSRMLINHLVSNGVTDLVIGYNKEWKQGINIGKRNNQNFVQIPFYKLINMLTYKCELSGISVVLNEESYTSKCSFLDSEELCKHEEYLGKRISRGLFKSGDGRIINADVNGSYNILRKVVGEFDYDSILVCSTPAKLSVSLN